jgi:DNA-binding beta-propeller fold protein YncE
MCTLLILTVFAAPAQAQGSDYLLLTDWDEHTVLRYEAATGAFVDAFVPKKSGGLNDPVGLLFGPHDGMLYVASGQFAGNGELRGVPRYDGTSGAFIDVFASDGNLTSPRGIIFGSDGNLYVADRPAIGEGRIVRYDGTTGAYLDDFVPISSDGLSNPVGLVFGPSGEPDGSFDLYVASTASDSISRYDGSTGNYLGDFVASGTAELNHPTGLTIGPDGNLYVANWALGTGRLAVLRFQGPTGESPGAPLPSAGNTGADFVPPGSGGLLAPQGLIFGPDGNGDGHLDLYVTNIEVTGSFKAKQHTGTVKRYDGITGAFIDTFITAGSGGLRDPFFLTFTHTDPVTLEYLGAASSLAAVHAVPEPSCPLLGFVGVLAVAIACRRWRRAGKNGTPG